MIPAVGEGSLAEVDSPEGEGSPAVGEALHQQYKEVGQTYCTEKEVNDIAN